MYDVTANTNTDNNATDVESQWMRWSYRWCVFFGPGELVQTLFFSLLPILDSRTGYSEMFTIYVYGAELYGLSMTNYKMIYDSD